MTQQVQRLGSHLHKRLESLKKHGVVREVRGKGLFRGVELVRDSESLAPFPELGSALKKTTLKNGLIIRVDPNWFAVSPAFVANEEDIDEMCDLIEKSLLEALELADQQSVS